MAVLALPFDRQQLWLIGMGARLIAATDVVTAPVNELAVEFGEAALHADQMAEAGWISPDTFAAIMELDAYLGERSGPHNWAFWTFDALRDHPDWERAREFALGILITIE